MASILIDDWGEMRDAVAALRRVISEGPGHVEGFQHEGRKLVVLDASALESLLEHLHVLTPLANTRAFVEAADEDESGQTVNVTADTLAELRALLAAGRTQGADVVLGTMEDQATGHDPNGAPADDASIGSRGVATLKAVRALE